MAGMFATLPITATYNYFTGENTTPNILKEEIGKVKKKPKSRRKRNFNPRFNTQRTDTARPKKQKKQKIILPTVEFRNRAFGSKVEPNFSKNIAFDDNPCNPFVRNRIIRETGKDPCPL